MLAVAAPTAAEAATDDPGSHRAGIVDATAASAAADRVRDHLTVHPAPEPGGVDERLAWLRAFPFADGLAQWGCELGEVDHSIVPATVGSAARVQTALTSDCGPETDMPGLAELTRPRTGVLDGTEARGIDPVATCSTLRQASQCLTAFPAGQRETGGSYTWLGTGPMTGRLRIEGLPPMWPTACGVGTPQAVGPTFTVQPGDTVWLFVDPAPGTVRSVTWDEFVGGGTPVVRSVFCALEPPQPTSDLP
jgi:hypothetical protein